MVPTTTAPVRRDAGHELREARRAAGLTQAQLAAAADCSLAFVGQLEAGAVPKRSRTVERIFAALAARPDDARPVDENRARVRPSTDGLAGPRSEP